MPEFENNERLFRKIPDLPSYVKEDENGKRISSAAFKDSLGCSVDRQANREREIIQNQFYSRFHNEKSGIAAVADVSFLDCCNVNAIVKEDPIDGNPFHCEIHRSETKIQLSPSQAKKLADIANVKFFKASCLR